MSKRNKAALVCFISFFISMVLFKGVKEFEIKRKSLVLPSPLILADVWLPKGVVFEDNLLLGGAPTVFLTIDDFRRRFPAGGTVFFDRTEEHKIRIVHEEGGLWYVSFAQYGVNPWGYWVSIGKMEVVNGQVIIYPRKSTNNILCGSFFLFFLLISVVVTVLSFFKMKNG